MAKVRAVDGTTVSLEDRIASATQSSKPVAINPKEVSKSGINGCIGFYSAKLKEFMYIGNTNDINFWKPMESSAAIDSAFAMNSVLQHQLYDVVQEVGAVMIEKNIPSALVHEASLSELGVDPEAYPVFCAVFEDPKIRCIRLTNRAAKVTELAHVGSKAEAKSIF